MVNPLKTEHAIDWSKTAQEIEDQFQAGMIERDRYREALEKIADTDPDDLQVFHDIANKALVDA